MNNVIQIKSEYDWVAECGICGGQHFFLVFTDEHCTAVKGVQCAYCEDFEAWAIEYEKVIAEESTEDGPG